MTRWLPAMVLALGCSKFHQTKECSSLAKVTNSFVAESAAWKPSNSTEPALIAKENRETAARYEKLAKDLAALRIDSKVLATHVNSYRDIASKAAQSLQDVAAALEAGDFELARQKRVEFDATARGETPLVEQINKTCR